MTTRSNRSRKTLASRAFSTHLRDPTSRAGQADAGGSREAYRSLAASTGTQPRSLASAAPTSDALLLVTTADVRPLAADGTKLGPTLPLPSSAGSPTCAAVSPSGKLAAVGTDESKVFLLDAKSGEVRHTLELRAQPTALAFPPDEGTGVIAIGLATGKVPLYNVESGEIVNARYGSSGSSHWSPQREATSRQGPLALTHRVVDPSLARTGADPWIRRSRSWSDISARVTSLAFSPSGSHLAASSLDESIRIYSVKSPSTILSLKNL